MSIKPLAAAAAFLLGGCVYTETPYGRMAMVRSETTINKNVTVNAPPGTTVIYQDSVPVGYPRPYPYRYYGY